MFTRSRMLLALCASAVTLAAGATGAAATVNRYLVWPQRFTATSSGATTFSEGGISVSCNLTLEGSFASSIGATSGETAGSITRATGSGCTGAERAAVTFLSLPWSLVYRSFSGTQPEGMTAWLMAIRGFSGNVSTSLGSCLYRGDVGLRLPLTRSNPYEVGTFTTLANSLSLVSGFFCESTGSMSGSYTHTGGLQLAEGPILELAASPESVEKALAMGGTAVRFRPNIMTVEPRTGGWRDGSTGWTTNIMPCLNTISYPSGTCEITITSEPNARPNLLRLFNLAGTLVGQVPVG
jgi:hypothetical protein